MTSEPAFPSSVGSARDLHSDPYTEPDREERTGLARRATFHEGTAHGTRHVPRGDAVSVPCLRQQGRLGRGSGRKEFSERGRFIIWVGSVLRINTVGPVDRSITIEPMRSCPEAVPLDGPEGILAALSPAHRAAVEQALSGSAGYCGTETWQALRAALRQSHPELTPYIDWLLARLNPVVFRPDDAADRAWQEQKDAADSLTRLTDFPHSALAAWDRPLNRDDTYLAGLIPEPSSKA